MDMIQKKWFKCAMTRAIRTFAQTMIASLTTATILSEVNWKIAFSSSVLAGVISILMSISGLPEINETVTEEETVTDDEDDFEDIINAIDGAEDVIVALDEGDGTSMIAASEE